MTATFLTIQAVNAGEWYCRRSQMRQVRGT